jgi:hypothetical protein
VVSVTPRPLFTPGERTPGTHWIGGWAGPRASLDAGGGDSQPKFSNSKHNKRGSKHREIFKRLIDGTCPLESQELHFGGHDESDSSLNRGKYTEFLQLLEDYYPLLNDHLETATVFKGRSAAIQSDLIEAILEVTPGEVSRQIQESPCVTMLLDETSDIQMVSQLATGLRYVHDGKI